MGFYGNITNTSKVQFQFDRIYPNRYEMEGKTAADGVYIGRYVLIEYDSETWDTGIFKSQFYKVDGNFYTSKNAELTTRVKIGSGKNDVNNGDIIRIAPENNYVNGDNKASMYSEFWRCSGATGDIAVFEELEYDDNAYSVNYEIDREHYSAGRGFDSTVWQKIYQDGREKYVMVAELNTVVPTFDISADPPTLDPITPHFDGSSTNVYYKLHAQPQWGFRIKEAKPDKKDDTTTDKNELPSDVNISHKYYKYHKDTNILEEVSTEPYQGAIYWNDAGFDSSKKTYKEDLEDDIKISPTGKSGNLYNAHDGKVGSTATFPDIQELTVMLPSIGNAISDMWDLVYNNPGNEQTRNKDVNWGSVKGVRMVEEDTASHGFSYKPKQTQTIAGAINSVHDLMGMIIEETSLENVEEALLDKIYWINNKYWVKYLDYEYEALTEEEMANPENLKVYKEITLTQYEPNTYYNHDGAYNYIVDKDDINYELKYYTLDKSETAPMTLNYQSRKYYTLDESGKIYWLESGDNIDFTKTYYDIAWSKAKSIYFPGIYWLKNEETGEWDLCQEESFDKDKTYFKETATKDEDGKIKYVYESIELQEFDSNGMWRLDQGNYYKDEVPAKATQYYYLAKPEDAVEYKDLYQASKYYYEENGSYYLDNNSSFTQNRTYYRLTAKEFDGTFYRPGKFYILTAGAYNFDDSPEMQNIQYYDKDGVYVIKDDNNIAQLYSEWNENVLPPTDGSVELARRNEKWSFKELTGFARTLNTIHGLIIKINQMLAYDEEKTRDTSTLQGAINYLNDVIARFTLPEVEEIMIVDNYGRYHSAPQTTAQDFTSKNINNEVNTIEGIAENRFISIKVDGDVKDPKITINHEFNAHANTITDSDKNLTTGTGLNTGNDDTVKLYTPWVDNTGHVNGHNIETVTLPYGFAGIRSYNSSNETVYSNNERVPAVSTKDTLQISAGNKWLKVNATSEDTNVKGLGIYHILTESPKGTDQTTNLNDSTNGTFSFTSSDTIDNAGHLTGYHSHTYTLPYGYKTVEVQNTSAQTIPSAFTNGTIVADNHVDILNIHGGHDWIKMNVSADNDLFTIYHGRPGTITSSFGETANRTLEFGQGFKVRQSNYDLLGHLNSATDYTMTLPTLLVEKPHTWDGSVLTDLNVAQNGTLTPTWTQMSKIGLVDWSYNETNPTNIREGDSLMTALSKLQAKLEGPASVEGTVSNKFANLIGTAPEALDTLGEIATVLGDPNNAEAAGLIKDVETLKSQMTADLDVPGSVGNIVLDLNTEIEARLEDVENLVTGKSNEEGVMKWYSGPTQPSAPAIDSEGNPIAGYTMWVNSANGKIHFYNFVTGVWEAINTWQ